MMHTVAQRRLWHWFAWLPFTVLAGSVLAQGVAPTDSATGSRSFFHWDLNASGFYSSRGATLSGTGFSHWQPTDRIPRNYLGFEYIATVGEGSPLRTLLGPLEFTTVDLNPHLEVDFNPPVSMSAAERAKETSVELDDLHIDVNTDNGDHRVRLKIVLHDFWLRFEPAGMERTTLRVGHFDIPYGVNPVMAPRGGVFVMPPEIDDIGLKKDWGLGWKAPLGQYDYELAVTSGGGLGLHDPHWFGTAGASSYLLSARAGAPTYWHFQYGLSGLYGKTPQVMADERFGDPTVERWRINADAFYKLREHTIFMSQIGYGENGGPFEHDPHRANVLATHFLVDHVPPWFQMLDLKAQVKSVFSDLDRSDDHTLALFEVAYSLTTPIMLRLDYVHDFTITRAMKMMGQHPDDRIFLTLNYYD